MSGPDDAERDAWLREALRHAPDADVAPPPRLRANILREASEATAGGLARVAAPARWLGALLERPVWATGLASVFVGTVALAVWAPWSGPPETASLAMTTPKATAPAAASEAPATPPATPPAMKPEVVAAAEPPPAARTAERAKVTPAVVAATPAPTPTPAATAAAPAAAPPAPQTAGTARSAATADAAAAPARPRAEVPSPLVAPRRGLRTEPDQWTWQRGNQDPQPVNDALRQWIDKLEAATAGRWESIEADPPGVRQLATLTLLREERVHTILRLEADGISRRGSPRLRAPLDAATASSLAAELRQIGP